MTTSTPTGQAPAKASGKATTSLVLGILGLVCCAILAPVAWFMGSSELKEIRAGRSAQAGEGLAKAGMILGIIGSVFFILGVMWVFFAGGLAFLGAIMEGNL